MAVMHRILYKDNIFGVCSHNMEMEEDSTNNFWKVARENEIENKMKLLNIKMALKGEPLGEGIHNNKCKIRWHKVFFFFTAFAIDNFRYYNFEEKENILQKPELPMVPVINSDYTLENDIETIVKPANIKSKMNAQAWAEGIVKPPYEDKVDAELSNTFIKGRITFKAINPEL
jgi:hypothetical protein